MRLPIKPPAIKENGRKNDPVATSRTWVKVGALPLFATPVGNESAGRHAAPTGDNIHIGMSRLPKESGLCAPAVMLEFGPVEPAEPWLIRPIVCYGGILICRNLTFPNRGGPRVMRLERPFWEKATAIHVFLRAGGGFR